MVELSTYGSGEGSSWATGWSYSTDIFRDLKAGDTLSEYLSLDQGDSAIAVGLHRPVMRVGTAAVFSPQSGISRSRRRR